MEKNQKISRIPIHWRRTLHWTLRTVNASALLGIVATAWFLSTAPSVQKFASAGTVSSPPGTVAIDCSRDVTAELQGWINGVPDGTTLQFGTNACYRVDGTLAVTNRNNLTFEGSGATLKQVTDGREASDPRTRMMFNFLRGSNLIIRNIIIQGANPNAGVGDAGYVEALEAQHGFGVHSIQGMTIENTQVYDIYGDDVYIGNQGGVLARNIIVRNNHFERNGRQGIGIVGAEDILIEHNIITQIRRSTIDIEPNTEAGAVRRMMFRDNDIGPGRLLFFANQGAAAPIEDISFVNNRFNGKLLQVQSRITGTGSGKRQRYKFIGNTSNASVGNPLGAAMIFADITDLEVSGNTIPMDAGRNMALVGITNVNGSRVTGNTILNGAVSVRIGTGNQNYCYADNKISNPLKVEASTFLCSVAIPSSGPSPVTAGNPSSIPTNAYSSAAAGNQSTGVAGQPDSSASEDPFAPTNSTNGGSSKKNTLNSDIDSVSGWQAYRPDKVIKAIPYTLRQLFANPKGIGLLLSNPLERNAFILILILVIVVPLILEFAYFRHRHPFPVFARIKHEIENRQQHLTQPVHKPGEIIHPSSKVH